MEHGLDQSQISDPKVTSRASTWVGISLEKASTWAGISLETARFWTSIWKRISQEKLRTCHHGQEKLITSNVQKTILYARIK